MSENERWLYEEVKKEEKVECSQVKGIDPLKGDYTYRFVGGREEAVDLSKIGVEGLCCPHIRDVPGAAVLKYCGLQKITFFTDTGPKWSYAQCGPLCYINNWKICPYREALGGKPVE
jgi:hypothetical protein